MGESTFEPLWKDTQGSAYEPHRADDPRGAALFGAPARSSRYHSALIVAAAIAGAALMVIAVDAFREWRVRVAIEQMTRASQDALRQINAQNEQAQRDAQAREAMRQANLEKQEAARLRAIAQRQQADEAVKRAALEEADRKEKAWAKFYRKPAACNDAVTLECANAHIRAKRAFEDKYARGEL
jgi:multidrug efflux pump subunit AcrA (membrane-fusion protein)